jgi:hypothetical protein
VKQIPGFRAGRPGNVFAIRSSDLEPIAKARSWKLCGDACGPQVPVVALHLDPIAFNLGTLALHFIVNASTLDDGTADALKTHLVPTRAHNGVRVPLR